MQFAADPAFQSDRHGQRDGRAGDGIRRIVMVTGDREDNAQTVGAVIGVLQVALGVQLVINGLRLLNAMSGTGG